MMCRILLKWRLRAQLGLLLVSATAYGNPNDASFWADTCAWLASDVVVVDEFGVVRETWKGRLTPGETVPLDVLAIPKDLRIFPDPNDGQPPRYLTSSGGNMVLFLKRHLRPDQRFNWVPADDFDGMKTSMAWFRGQTVYSFQQWTRPGTASLEADRRSVAEFQQDVKAVIRGQQDLAKAKLIADPGSRARALLPVLAHGGLPPRGEALDLLESCGHAGTPTVAELLGRGDCVALHTILLGMLTRIEQENARPQVTQALTDELSYWRAWREQRWGQDSGPQMEKLTETFKWVARFGLTPDEKVLITKLRDLLATIPEFAGWGSPASLLIGVTGDALASPVAPLGTFRLELGLATRVGIGSHTFRWVLVSFVLISVAGIAYWSWRHSNGPPAKRG